MKIKNLSLFTFAVFSFLCAEESIEPDMAHVSEAFGYIIYNNFNKLNVKFDLEKIIQGIKNADAGKESPITEQECIDALYSIQKKTFKMLSNENLKKAEMFLASNAKKEGIVCLEEGKVQYQVISSGNGPEVKLHSSPLIRHTLKPLDESDVLVSAEAESISLDETISGLKAGLLGMKEGEKRILYIHPDLAYDEKEFLMLLPKALLVFEIEVLKADTRN